MTQKTVTFHYPAELFELVVEAIPRLVRSKRAVIDFFKGAGVPRELLADWAKRERTDRDNIRKHEIARSVVERLNREERFLEQRREVIKRITEFDSFRTCYPNVQLEAKGLVSDIQDFVKKKDFFTRLAQEQEKEAAEQRRARAAELEKKAAILKERQQLKSEFYALFFERNPQNRGKELESVLNRLFASFGILVKERFTVNGVNSEGIIEQIDGVVELYGHLYLVEVKWLKEPVGVPEVSQHLSRLYHRADVRGIIVSASGFGEPAVTTARDALNQKVLVLCELEEIVVALENEFDLKDVFRFKSDEAQLRKNPLHVIRATSSLEAQ